MAIEEENTAIDELIRSTEAHQARQATAPGRTEASLRPRAITTTMPLPMEPLRRRPRATPPVPTRTTVRALVPAPPPTDDDTLVLPAYVPAPDVGDPAEADATVPVEQFDFTELVDRHRIYLDPTPAKPSPLRFLPAFGLVLLAGAFVVGYLVFDAEVRTPRAAAAQVVAPAPKPIAIAAPMPEVPTAPAALELAHEPTDTPKVPAFLPPVAAQDEQPVEAPKPVRTAVYVSSSKPVEIFVDGKSANATAPRKLYLSPGRHKITLWDTASGKTETFKLELAPGQVTPLQRRF